MEKISNVREVFQALGERLYLYESEKYLTNNPFGESMANDFPFEFPFDYYDEMDEIGKAVNLYDPAEVYRETMYYIGRIQKVLKKLKRRTHKIVWDSADIIVVGGITYPKVRKVKLLQKEQELLFKEWKKELNFCLSFLQEIREVRSQAIEQDHNQTITKKNIQINLPTNFTITEFRKHFESSVSPKQAALLLSYLKEMKAIPPYGPTDMGRIGKILFAIHEKSLTKGRLDNEAVGKDLHDLQQLQSLLKKMLSIIEIDIKEAV